MLIPAAVPAGTDPVKLGGSLPFCVRYGGLAKSTEQAYRLWEKQINQEGGLLGRPVSIQIHNDQGDPALAREIYRKLIEEDKVDMLLAPFGTPITLAVSEVTEEKGYVLLSSGAAGREVWTRGYKNVFGILDQADRFFIGLLDLLARERFRTVAIVHEDSPMHEDTAAGAQRWAGLFGLDVKGVIAYHDAATEMPSIINKLRQWDADGVLFSCYPAACYLSLEVMKADKYRPRVIGMTIAPNRDDFYERMGDSAEGIFSPSIWEPDARLPYPGARKFVEDYTRFSGQHPSEGAAAAYAECQLLTRAVEAVGSFDQQQLAAYIRSADTVTIFGRFKVDDTGGQIGHTILTTQWQDGKREIVYPPRMQTAPPRFDMGN